MKKIIIFGLVAVVAWAALVNRPVAGYDPVDYARREAEAQRIAQEAQVDAMIAPTRAVALNLALILFTLMIPIGAGMWGWAALLRYQNERRPDQRGVLPVAARDLRRLSPAALAEYHRAEQARAAIAPVPHTFAPHVTYQHKSEGALAPEAEPAPLALPGITDLATINHTPTLQSILLGLGVGGVPITVPAKALCHVALCGQTGGGKSNIMRLILPQLEAAGAKVVLADPHYADVDVDSGDDWRPIRSRLAIAPAVHTKDIGALLDYLARRLEERKILRERGQPLGQPIFLALDELPVITKEVDGASERLAKLLREGRKFGLFIIGASQGFLIKTIGGDSSARDCYRTTFYLGGDLVSARALLDMPQREIDEGALQTGIAYLRSAASTPAQLVRVPLASNRAISRMLEVPTSAVRANVAVEAEPEVPTSVVTSRRPDALNPKAAKVRKLMLQRASQNEIIAAVWGISGGRGYQAAAEELRTIQAELVGG